MQKIDQGLCENKFFEPFSAQSGKKAFVSGPPITTCDNQLDKSNKPSKCMQNRHSAAFVSPHFLIKICLQNANCRTQCCWNQQGPLHLHAAPSKSYEVTDQLVCTLGLDMVMLPLLNLSVPQSARMLEQVLHICSSLSRVAAAIRAECTVAPSTSRTDKGPAAGWNMYFKTSMVLPRLLRFRGVNSPSQISCTAHKHSWWVQIVFWCTQKTSNSQLAKHTPGLLNVLVWGRDRRLSCPSTKTDGPKRQLS